MSVPDSYALWIEDGGTVNNATDYRRLLKSLMGGAEGVATASSLAVSEKSGTPNMSVDVAAGGLFVNGTEDTHQGVYYVYNDAVLNVAISAADATNPRKDLVVSDCRDSEFSGADDDARIRVITGTPAASPAEPSVPDNCYVLALVDVDALAASIVNADITDRRSVAQAGPPTGTILMNGASTAPAGWLTCDGTAVSRSTYADLFARVGTTWGAGNGTTTFNIPDLRGRSPIGAGTGSGLTARTLGTQYGTETHALSVAELPAHSHGGATGSGGPTTHYHNTDSGNRFVVTEAASTQYTTTSAGGQAVSFSDVDSHAAHTHTVSSEGSGTAHTSLHPVAAVHYIIKT